MRFAVIAVAAILAWAIAYGLTDTFKIRQRWVACALSFCAVVAVALVVGTNAATPIEPGDFEESTHQTATNYVPGVSWERQKQITINTFLVLLIPTLTGAWMGTTGKRNAVKPSEAI